MTSISEKQKHNSTSIDSIRVVDGNKSLVVEEGRKRKKSASTTGMKRKKSASTTTGMKRKKSASTTGKKRKKSEESTTGKKRKKQKYVKRDPLLYFSHPMSPEQYATYLKHLDETQGFDMPCLPPGVRPNLCIVPYRSGYENKYLNMYVSKAIEHYKDTVDQNAKLGPAKIINVCSSNSGRYSRQYITFEAIDEADNDELKTYQTVVTESHDYLKVEVCRLKPMAGLAATVPLDIPKAYLYSGVKDDA